MSRALSRREMIAASGALALLAACGGGERERMGPQPIAVGIDECAWCRMLIDEERLAAQFVPAGGRVSSFGEVGCLLAWLASAADTSGASYVKAFDTGGWLRAESAHYATGQVRTPMRFDLTAHSTPPSGGSEAWDAIRRKGAPHARQG
jgi:copper chaperone NosL